MTTAEQLQRFDFWLATHPAPWSHDPNTTQPVFEDEDTLRRSRYAPPSAYSYRRAADRPTEPWADDLAVATGPVRAWEVER